MERRHKQLKDGGSVIRQAHALIYFKTHESGFVTAADIYREIYGVEPVGNDIVAVYQLAHRIKDKFGESSIVLEPGKGYVSRRALIDRMVEKNRGRVE